MKSSITYCKSLVNDNSVEFRHFSLGAISMTPGKGYYTVPEGGQKISNHPGWGYLTALGGGGEKCPLAQSLNSTLNGRI